MKKVGVIISGCGVFDGAEIHETVATLVALEKYELEAVCLAPNVDQLHVVNHLTQEVAEGEQRNVLVEAARIARGSISELTPDVAANLDAIVLPGGFGAAKNLSTYAVKGTEMEVLSVVEETLTQIKAAGKPIAALCIAPIILAKVFGDENPALTLGSEGPDAENMTALGGNHQVTTHEEVVVDLKNKIVTGPCYMLDASIGNVMRGADAVIQKLKEMM